MGWMLLILLFFIPSLVQAQQCTQQQLHDEFVNDVTARGFAACASDGNVEGANNDDQCTLDKFNQPCTDHAQCKTDNVLTREQILETLVDSAELEKLSRSTVPNDVARKSQLEWLLSSSPFNMAKASWQQKWKNIFTPADSPITNAAINAAQLKDAPRSHSVCGRTGTLNDVSCGLRATGCQ